MPVYRSKYFMLNPRRSSSCNISDKKQLLLKDTFISVLAAETCCDPQETIFFGEGVSFHFFNVKE